MNNFSPQLNIIATLLKIFIFSLKIYFYFNIEEYYRAKRDRCVLNSNPTTSTAQQRKNAGVEKE